MKLTAKLFIVVTVCLSLSPTLTFAQGRRGGPIMRNRIGTVAMDQRTVLLLVSTLLDLSGSQQLQLVSIFDDAVKTAGPINTQIEAGEEQLFEAIKAGKTDDQIKNLAQQQGVLATQLEALQAQTLSKMLAILNADQKPKVDAAMYSDLGQFLSNAQGLATPPSVGLPPGAAVPVPAEK